MSAVNENFEIFTMSLYIFQDAINQKICWSIELLLFLIFFLLQGYFLKIEPCKKSYKSITNNPRLLLVYILLIKNVIQSSDSSLVITGMW